MDSSTSAKDPDPDSSSHIPEALHQPTSNSPPSLSPQERICRAETWSAPAEEDCDDQLAASLLQDSSKAALDWSDPWEDLNNPLSKSPDICIDPIFNRTPSSDSSNLTETSTHRKRKRTNSLSSAEPEESDFLEDGHGFISENTSPSAAKLAIPSLSVPKIPRDAAWVTQRLKTYGMIQDDKKAYQSYPQLVKKVDAILQAKRMSEVDEEEFSAAQETMTTYQDFNEDTILNQMIPYIIKDRRTVSLPPTSPPPSAGKESSSTEGQALNQADNDTHYVASFLSSGLLQISNREFSRSFLPFREDASQLDRDVVKALQKQDGMTNPRPDRTYAVSTSKYQFPTGFRIPPLIAAHLEIMRGCHHPFFFIEGKSFAGDLRDARNQACRGGTCLVRCARLLRETLDISNVTEGVDLQTFCFSATLSPNLIEIWVHWAEVVTVQPESVNWHMTRLASKALGDWETFGHTRRMLHNILDWGTGARFRELGSIYQRIIAYEAEEKEKKEVAAVAAKADKASNKRSRRDTESSEI